MNIWRSLSSTVNLRQAAAIIFALTAVLPLLLFMFLLNRFGLLGRTEAQVSLFLAVLISVLGFVVFRRMAERISRLAQTLGTPKPQDRPTPQGKVEGPMVPGLGAVAEVAQIRDAFGQMLENLRGSTGRLEDLVFKLVTLNEVVELAAKTPKIQDLLSLILDRAMRTLRAGVGSIMLLDKETGTLRIAAARGLPDDLLTGDEVKVGEELAGTVAQFGEPIRIDNMETDPRFGGAHNRKYGGGSVMSVPVRVGDRLIGVINLAKREYGASTFLESPWFSSLDLQFLNALMTYVAYALENARLLEETRQSAERLEEVIDDLKVAQEQLVRGESLRAIGVLASGVTHHLNNLLAVNLGRIQFLLRKVEDPAVRHSLEAAERAALDAAEVVRQVREFSQVRPAAEAGSADLNQLAQEVLELTRPHWQDEAQLHGIRIQASLEAGEIPPVTGDPASLREVLMSLVLNAVDAMPQGGQISVRTWASKQGVYCSVADTGVGMSEQVRRRALEPFFTTKGPKSTGLGLSVSYGIIQRHGGDLAIESEDGKGTTVTIRLPHVPAAPVCGSVEEQSLVPVEQGLAR